MEGERILAEDDAYVIASMEAAIGLGGVESGDGTETAPTVVGCPVHQQSTQWPWEEWFPDPDLPDEGDQPQGGVENPGENLLPIDPSEPEIPDVSDNITDWWNDFVGMN